MGLISMIPFAQIVLFKARYKGIREPKAEGPVEFNASTEGKVINGLKGLGIGVEDFGIDLRKYEEYFEKAGYSTKYPGYYSFNIREKSLEHFIASELLGIRKNDVYIDIASEGSPVPEIYSGLFGCRAYRQDLSYPAGFNNDRIGGSAERMPVPDGFADSMALHCSFEHFEGGSDIGFIREASRVLRKGGRCCIVPLYLFERYAVQTDPGSHAGVAFESDATVYCARGWGNRHGRFYDPVHLKKRVIDNLGDLKGRLFRITNAGEVDKSCYARFALLLEKKG